MTRVMLLVAVALAIACGDDDGAQVPVDAAADVALAEEMERREEEIEELQQLEAIDEAYRAGFAAGHDEGYRQGFADGLRQGLQDARQN